MKRKIAAERAKIQGVMEEDMNKFIGGLVVYDKLPAGHSAKEVKDIAELYLKLGKYKLHYITNVLYKHINFIYLIQGETDWSGGALSGGVYNFDKEVNDLITQVYGMTAWTNPLHPDVFPGIRKMEAEIVQMGADMFHGGPGTCGTVFST